MRLALSCVLLLPAALYLLLCHAQAAAAVANTNTEADTRHPTPLPPLDQPRHTRHDPLIGLGIMAGLPRLLSITSQNTPLNSQLLDAIGPIPVQRYPPGSLTPLANPLQRPAALHTQELRDINTFPLNDFELLQVLLDRNNGGFGRRRVSGGTEPEKGYSCWGHVPTADSSCPSSLLQILSGRVPRPREVLQYPNSPWTPLTSSSAVPWLKAQPSKRYLGIELPDYIATSYSSIKTDNAHYLTKLHQLKQRMRNAGK